MSAHSRPLSRASTTSATSQHNEEQQQALASQQIQPTPEDQLLQYQANSQQAAQSFQSGPPQQQIPIQHEQGAAYPPAQNMSFSHDSPYLQPQDGAFGNPVRMGSVPVGNGLEAHDDKRRKTSAATATNDKELREMLARNEGRPLRDVAQEVIQKERTPMAEKTKQLFAMLW